MAKKPRSGSLSNSQQEREAGVKREETEVVYRSGGLNDLANSREDMDEPGERVLNSAIPHEAADDNSEVEENVEELWDQTSNPEDQTSLSPHELSLEDPALNARDDLTHDLEDLKAVSTPGVLAVLPKSVKFESQATGEQVILVMRRHPVTNLRWIVIAILIAFMPLIVTLEIFAFNLPARYIIMGTLIWELMVLGYVFEEFLRWFFNIYIVTHRRIVDIDFYHLLYLEMSETDLSKIQDVSVVNKGIMASIFNFGDIHIQTAAEKNLFEFTAVKDPDKIASVIRILSQHREAQMGGRD